MNLIIGTIFMVALVASYAHAKKSHFDEMTSTIQVTFVESLT